MCKCQCRPPAVYYELWPHWRLQPGRSAEPQKGFDLIGYVMPHFVTQYKLYTYHDQLIFIRLLGELAKLLVFIMFYLSKMVYEGESS